MTRRLGIVLCASGTLALAIAYGCGSDSDGFSRSPEEEAGAGGVPPATGGAPSGGQAGSGGSGGVVATAGSAGSAGSAGASTAGAGGEAGAPGGAGEAGDAGAGGAAPPPCSVLDADNDGQTECDGDCDDADSNNWLGNTEICGDATDNNCDLVADEATLCVDIGTFVSALTGDDTNPGTMDLPVQTIAQGMHNAGLIMAAAGGSVSVYVAEGSYPEKVTLVQGVNLLGGFSCAAQPCSWSRSPAANVTEIVNQDFEGVLADGTISRATRLDGFTITGFGGAAAGRGSAGLTLQSGTPTITNNVIVGGDITGGSGVAASSSGIAILPPANDVLGALIDSNTITAGTSANLAVGVLFDGGAIWPPVGRNYAVVTRNVIRGGSGPTARGVLSWWSGRGTLIRNNDIFAGDAQGDAATAWGIESESLLDVDANRINADLGDPPTCTAPARWCGGILSGSMTGAITNNVVFGVSGPNSAAVYLTEMEQAVGAVSLNANYLDGAGLSGSATSVSAALAMSRQQTDISSQYVLVGRVFNNILVGGQAGARFGIYEIETWDGKLVHPEALQHNDFVVSGLVSGTDAYYLLWDGAAQHRIETIAEVNGLNAAGLLPVLTVGNIDDDTCVDGTYHLVAGASCLDAGVATEAPPRDFEGDPRPQGPAVDIGPDEAPDQSTSLP